MKTNFKIGNVDVLFKYNLRKSYSSASSACYIRKLEDGLPEAKATIQWFLFLLAKHGILAIYLVLIATEAVVL